MISNHRVFSPRISAFSSHARETKSDEHKCEKEQSEKNTQKKARKKSEYFSEFGKVRAKNLPSICSIASKTMREFFEIISKKIVISRPISKHKLIMRVFCARGNF